MLLSGPDTGLINSFVIICLAGMWAEAWEQGEVSVSIILGQEMTRKVALRRERGLLPFSGPCLLSLVSKESRWHGGIRCKLSLGDWTGRREGGSPGRP